MTFQCFEELSSQCSLKTFQLTMATLVAGALLVAISVPSVCEEAQPPQKDMHTKETVIYNWVRLERAYQDRFSSDVKSLTAFRLL